MYPINSNSNKDISKIKKQFIYYDTIGIDGFAKWAAWGEGDAQR